MGDLAEGARDQERAHRCPPGRDRRELRRRDREQDLEGIVTSWNRAAERLFGYAEEMIGRLIALLAAPGREDEMPAILARIRRGERGLSLGHYRMRADGLTVQPVVVHGEAQVLGMHRAGTAALVSLFAEAVGAARPPAGSA